MNLYKYAFAILVVVFIHGCSIGERPEPQQTPAPTPPYDGRLNQTPDPQPRFEPPSRSGNGPVYQVFGKYYEVLDYNEGYKERGIASWYGKKFHGRKTSNGETYDMYAMTAAHKTLILPAYVEVTNLRNGRSVVVRVNDRGPFVKNRLIDMSYTAALKLDMVRDGTAPVEVRVVTPYNQRTQSLPQSDKTMFLQLGAFRDRNNAVRMRNHYQGSQVPNIRIQKTEDASGALYRVRVGPFDTVKELDRMTDILSNLGLEDLQLVMDR